MKMHMKAVHGTSRPKRASKRLLPNFTPEIKPSKRSKKVKPLNMETMINSEVSIEDDNSILLVDDTFSGKSMALEESIVVMDLDSPKAPSINNHIESDNMVKIKPMFSCEKCEFDSEIEGDLKAHITAAHRAKSDCINCRFSAEEEEVLKDHESDCALFTKAQNENAVHVNTKKSETVEVDISKHVKESMDAVSEPVKVYVKANAPLDDQPVVICGVCNAAFENVAECEQHMETHPSKCYLCDFKSDDCDKLNEHELKEHLFKKCEMGAHEGKCNKICVEPGKENELKSNNSSNVFVQSPPPNKMQINCNQCIFASNDAKVMEEHILKYHKQYSETCKFCGYEATSRDDMTSHMLTKHEDPELLSVISDQLSQVTQSFDLFEVFKVELKDVLNKMIGGHNSVMQELFLMRNNQTLDTRFKDIDLSLKKLSILLTEKSADTSSRSTFVLPTASSFSESSKPSSPLPKTCSTSKPKVPEPQFKKSTKQTSPTTSRKSPPPPDSPLHPKILFVGDSISAHANINVLADATQSDIVTAKAYSAVYDDVYNKAKKAAHFPKKNFLQVVPNEVVKDSYEHLIIQAGSVDITNLNTEANPTEYIDYFKQETVLSARNIFNSGLLALEHQPSLKSIVIMKQTPRYDPHDKDPLSLKPALSQLFNNTIMELWINCPMKEKIHIGSHNIDCSGAVQSARYRHTKTGRFDGVHLYGSSGSKAYTLSVLNILRSAGLISSDHDYHLSCAQYKYQHRNQGN